MFDYCKPSLIVMSDGPVQSDSQQMANTYAQHITGSYFTSGGTTSLRKVVTTRKDGNIFWEMQ